MKEISRRSFFSALLPKINEQKKSEEHLYNSSQIAALGPISLFPVHTICKINLFNQNFVLHSLSEGVRLFDEENKVVTKLSLGPDGQLYAHLGEPWPDNAVLSLFTGEIYNI